MHGSAGRITGLLAAVITTAVLGAGCDQPTAPATPTPAAATVQTTTASTTTETAPPTVPSAVPTTIDTGTTTTVPPIPPAPVTAAPSTVQPITAPPAAPAAPPVRHAGPNTVAPPPAAAPACGADDYVNVDGSCIHRPTQAPAAPAGATARCADGAYSFSTHRQGTCSSHGGVATWL